MSIAEIMNAEKIGYKDMAPMLYEALKHLENPSDDLLYDIEMSVAYIRVALNDKNIPDTVKRYSININKN